MPIDWNDEIKDGGKTKVMRICPRCGDKAYIAKSKATNQSRCAPCARKETFPNIK